MSWKNFDEKHQKRFDRDFVSCDELFERRFIIDTLLEQFYWLSHEDVSKAVKHCCETLPAPRSREIFIRALKNRLDVRG